MTELAGASGAVAISPVSISNVSSLIIDAADQRRRRGQRLADDQRQRRCARQRRLPGVSQRHGFQHVDRPERQARIDSTVAAEGSLDTTVATGAELVTHRFRQNGLTLADGAAATVLEDSTTAGASVLTSLSIGAGATLDITNNAVVVDYPAAGPSRAAIRDQIIAGRGGTGLGKTWNGQASPAARRRPPRSRVALGGLRRQRHHCRLGAYHDVPRRRRWTPRLC